jgi:hypothetical protein
MAEKLGGRPKGNPQVAARWQQEAEAITEVTSTMPKATMEALAEIDRQQAERKTQ